MELEQIGLFSRATSNIQEGIITIGDYLEGIKNGKWRGVIESLRSLPTKDEQSEFKKKYLHGVSLSCTFSGTRAKKNAVNHTGIMQVDFDGVDDIDHIRQRLESDPHTAFCFLSPRGNGIKAGIRVPKDIDGHRDAFLQYKYHINLNGFDDSVKDISRICFVSYDPEIYINPDAEEFEVLKTHKLTVKRNIVPVSSAIPNASQKTAQKTLDTAIKMICDMRAGEKHAQRLKVGMLLGGGIAAGYWTESEALMAIEPYVSETSSRAPYAMKCIKDAIEEGKKQPLEPSQSEINIRTSETKIQKKYEEKTGLTVDGTVSAESVFFTPLGISDGNHIIYNSKKGEPVSIKCIKKDDLMDLAPIDWWIAGYSEDGERINWDRAASDIMERCDKAGFFDSSKIRGRGVWSDCDSVVINTGDTLIVDGKNINHHLYKSKYLYRRMYPIDIQISSSPLTAPESSKLIEIFRYLPVNSNFNRDALLGWIFISVVGGCLKWRPHIWINAASGSGKSWILENIINKLIGNIAVLATGEETTEAGLRQSVGGDSLTVIHDEAEGKSEKGKRNLQAKLMLARQSSSETNATVLKGTVGGKASKFVMRSMFMFISTTMPEIDKADRARILQIGLIPSKLRKNSNESFGRLKDLLFSTINDDFCSRFRARAVSMIPVIRETVNILSSHIAVTVGDQRTADQYASLLAGFWCIYNDVPPTDVECEILISNYDIVSIDTLDNEEDKCLDTIMSMIPKEWNVKETIGERVQRVIVNNCDFTEVQELNRYGISLSRDRETIFFSGRNINLKSLLSGTSFYDTYRDELSRLDGAIDGTPHKILGKTTRCVSIPVNALSFEIDEVNQRSMF